jgi:hypothetical protein
MTNEDDKLKYIKAACFGIGIVIGLTMMLYVFEQSGAIAGAIGGMAGAMIGMAMFAIYVRIRG